MEKGYEMFITDLRRLLLAAMDMEEEKIYFAKKGEKYGCTGDRLFVECGDIESRARSVDYIRKNFMSGTVKSTNWKISFMTVYVK